MAAKKKITNKMYEVKVKDNPNCCGIGAGGVQFAYGKATVPSGRLADWFREHDGYEVTEVEGVEPDTADSGNDNGAE